MHQESHEHFMSPSFENLCDENFIFQQDSVSFRYSKYTSKLLQEKEINVLPSLSNLPDLNSIENVWGIMKNNFRNLKPRDKILFLD